MSNRDEFGRFLPGNTAARNKGSIDAKLRREDRKFIISLLRKFTFMKLYDLQDYARNNSDIIVIEAMLIKEYSEAIKHGNINFLKLIFNYLGVVELKAMAIQEVDKINKDDDEIRELNLTKEEKILLLEKYRELIEEEDESE